MSWQATFRRWFGLDAPVSSENQTMRELLNSGRTAKLAEDYRRALEALDRAVTLAQASGQTAAIAVIALHQAEVYIRLRDWERAAQLLTSILHTTETSDQPVAAAYTLAVFGVLAQAQGDWNEARSYYEQARARATAARSSGAEGRAIGHLAESYLHEGNASYAAHLLREALPKLNESGDLELSSAFVGMLGEAMIESGQVIEGQHLIGRALQLAEHTGYRVYIRRWSLVLGERAAAEGHYEEARRYAERILEIAPPEETSAEIVSACLLLSRAHSGTRAYALAVEAAERAVARSQTLDDATQMRARTGLGVALRMAGRSSEAVPYLREAAAARGAATETLRFLAAAQAEAGDPLAIDTYRRAIAQAETESSPLELAQLRRDLGLYYLRRHEWGQAIQVWQEALAVYEDQRHTAQAARLYCDIASARRALGQYARAMKDYEHALMLLNSVEDDDYETRGVVLANAAIAYADRGDVESAEAFFTDSITYAEKLDDIAAESTRRGNYGWFLVMIGRPRRAIATLETALRQSQGARLALPMAIQLDNLGLAYAAVSEFATAIDYHRRALLTLPPDTQHWRASICINLAHALLSVNERAEAQRLLDEALALGRERDSSEIVIRALTGVGRAAALAGDAAALASADEAVALARRTEQRRLLAEALATRSELLALDAQTDAASAAWDEAQRLFTMLHMPQAKVQPAWLKPASSEETPL